MKVETIEAYVENKGTSWETPNGKSLVGTCEIQLAENFEDMMELSERHTKDHNNWESPNEEQAVAFYNASRVIAARASIVAKSKSKKEPDSPLVLAVKKASKEKQAELERVLRENGFLG